MLASISHAQGTENALRTYAVFMVASWALLLASVIAAIVNYFSSNKAVRVVNGIMLVGSALWAFTVLLMTGNSYEASLFFIPVLLSALLLVLKQIKNSQAKAPASSYSWLIAISLLILQMGDKFVGMASLHWYTQPLVLVLLVVLYQRRRQPATSSMKARVLAGLKVGALGTSISTVIAFAVLAVDMNLFGIFGASSYAVPSPIALGYYLLLPVLSGSLIAVVTSAATAAIFRGSQ